MCQFNYVIIKNKKSVSFLRNRDYSCFDIFPGGYKAFCGSRNGTCDCGSMVGSLSHTLQEEGRYPATLSAKDYRRALDKKIESLDQKPAFLPEDMASLMEELPARLPWKNMREFRYYRRTFQRLLEFEPYICFTHIFDRPENLRLVKTLRLSALRIGDLALLCQDDVLMIRQ